MSGERRDCVCVRVEHRHGTLGGYANDRCRCDACRAAWRTYCQIRRVRIARERWGATPVRWTDSVGTARRLQALAAAGWSSDAIARFTGIRAGDLRELRRQAWPRISSDTAQLVTDLYDRIWDRAPTNERPYQVIASARAAGWLPPLAWDDDRIDDPDYHPAHVEPEPESPAVDEVLVYRLMSGTAHAAGHTRTAAEEIEAIRRLAERGMSDAQIGQRIGKSVAAVGKQRQRFGIPAGIPHGRTA